MNYGLPDEAERWLRENDPEFGKGEKPYLSQWQLNERQRKETSQRPEILDEIDFSSIQTGNYGTRGQKRILQKDRHRKGQRDTESW